MTRIIAIANQKGGVGKTTTVLNLATALVQLGQRVVMVDLDPQGSLSSILRKTPEPALLGAHLLLHGDSKQLGRASVRLASGAWLVPSTQAMGESEISPNYSLCGLQRALRQYQLPVDFVLIDTPPSIGRLTLTALVAAHQLLIPVQCQYMAMRGVRGIMQLVTQAHREGNPELALLGVLATMYRWGSEISAQLYSELRSVFGPRLLDMVIEDEEAVSVAPARGMSVVSHRPDSRSAAVFRWLAEEIISGRR